MLGIAAADWIVLAVYLVAITLIGLWAARRVKSASSFFIGDRKFGKMAMLFFTMGAGTHSDQAVSVVSKTYRVGAAGIWYQWLWLFVTPFFWLLAPVFRRMRAVTTADYFHARYGQGVAGLFALVGMLQLTINIGVMLKGSSAMITAASGGGIDPAFAIVAMTILFVIYGVAGGLNAAILTDVLQGILTIVLSFLILPFALNAVGGMAGLRESIADPDMLKIVAPKEITAFYIAVISLNALIGWVTQPQSFGMAAAGKTEIEGRFGVMGGLILKRICTIAWVVTGLCAIVLYAGTEMDADHAYGFMAHDLLPSIAPGLVGLFIASMLACVMSSCDAFMVASAALFTENLYRPLMARNRTDRHYMTVGRIASVLVVGSGIGFAFLLDDVVQGLEIFWKISPMMAIAFWVGLFWRKATPAAAWASTLVAFAAWLGTENLFWNPAACLENGPLAFLTFEGSIYLPWQMIFYLSAGLVTAVVVSLVTRPVSQDKLDRFYECIRTPVLTEEPETAPFTLPEGTSPAPRNVLISHPDFEIPKPTPVTIVGFFAGWIAVGALIWSFVWILNL
jgi:Na+/proline symporter